MKPLWADMLFANIIVAVYSRIPIVVVNVTRMVVCIDVFIFFQVYAMERKESNHLYQIQPGLV